MTDDAGADAPPARDPRAIGFMAKNTVAANMLMVLLLASGLIIAPSLAQEVFPEITLDQVIVTVPYPGATPEDVERGVVLAVEEAARGVDDVKEVRSSASEGLGVISAEVESSADVTRVRAEIESAVGRITSLPEDAERPTITVASNRREVLSLILHGDVDRDTLRHASETVRSDLLADEHITQVEITGLPPQEIVIEISEATLSELGLTLTEVAETVGRASVDVPGGTVRSPSQQARLRVHERRELAKQYGAVAVVAGEDGTMLTVNDLGTVTDGFRETDQRAFYDGEPAVRVRVYRVGEQTPIDVSDAVHAYLATSPLPESLGAAVYNDSSENYRGRIRLLLHNGYLGVVLVIAVLGLFLEPRLSFWVTLGIPISFLAGIAVMPLCGVSLNMISLFAFILTLGIVVDDAIVVGESIYKHRREGKSPLRAAIDGANEVKAPILFAVITTILAFVPLLVLPGTLGKFFDNIPLVVIPVLVFSLVESFFVLPSHLAHGHEKPTGVLAFVRRHQERFSVSFERSITRYFGPFVRGAVSRRYLTLAIGLGVLVLAASVVLGKRILFRFLPDIEGDTVTASLRMPAGTSPEVTRGVVDRLVQNARVAAQKEPDAIRGIYAEIGTSALEGGPSVGEPAEAGGHLAQVTLVLSDPERRDISGAALTKAWRRALGEVAGVDRLTFTYRIGPAAGEAIAIELSHEDHRVLEAAAGELADALDDYAGVFDVSDGVERGALQLDFFLEPEGRALGLTAAELGRQVRSAYFGAEARRIQRGRHEVRVYVKNPEAERQSLSDLDLRLVRTPGGGEMPLMDAARVTRARSPVTIDRVQGRRVLTVTADVDDAVTTGTELAATVSETTLPGLAERFPGLAYGLGGGEQDRRESLEALKRNMSVAILAMVVLLAVAFRSYTQPLLVLLAVPFGLVGALIGHLLLGFDISIISMLGMVALSGVVVNDSLVLIDAANRHRREGEAPFDAITHAAERRFRPILLTSLTTFFGLSPLIFERSIQARFLIPMAVSLGFGVLFVTVIALVIIPAGYMALDDLRRLRSR